MIKYIAEDTLVAFSEIPTEISLCVNISNCQNNCIGCHSSYLKENIGLELDFMAIDELLTKNRGITCICFMGEGNDVESLQKLMSYILEKYPETKIALYSGRKELNKESDKFYWDSIDYVKVGPYIEEFGPLNKETTNQRLYMKEDGIWKDITYMFLKKH